MTALFRAGVLGAQGYSGQVLVDILKKHPKFNVQAIAGRSDQPESLLGKVDVIFCCLPHEASLEWVPRYLDSGVSVVDLSGAFRLKKHSYSEWYGFEHKEPELLKSAVYGLQPFATIPEWKRGAEPILIANPGCYATAIELLLIPLLKTKLIDATNIAIDAKSGTTGAGRKANQDLLFSEVYSSFYPYRTGRHQHWPEIVESCEAIAKVSGVGPALVTELLPVDRGISVCAFLEWADSVPESQKLVSTLEEAWTRAFEGDSDFVLCREDQEMNIRLVRSTNQIRLRATISYGRIVVFAAIDNLMRGAASQAVMNANLMMGLKASEGL